MGQCLGVRFTDLEPALPVKDSLSNGGIRYYGFYISKSMKESGLDLVIKMQVLSGFFAGLIAAADEKFPSSRRRIWQQERFCLCESAECDYSWPECCNAKGGVCSSCRLHDANWSRTSHDLKLCGLAASPDFTDLQLKAGGQVGSKSKFADHSNCKFGLRLDLSNPDLPAGHYFLTVEALKMPEINEESGFVKELGVLQVKGKSEPATAAANSTNTNNGAIGNTNSYVIWLEQRVRRSEPFAGNESIKEETEIDRTFDEKSAIEL